MNKVIITSIPVHDNDGNSTLPALDRLLATLFTYDVKYSAMHGCFGWWYGEDGLYSDEVILFYLIGEEAVIRRALARFGQDTEQLAMLCVERLPKGAHVAGHGVGEEECLQLARTFGGCTLLPDNTAIAFHYQAIDCSEYAALAPEYPK